MDDAEFRWSTEWKVPTSFSQKQVEEFIDSRFLDVITSIAWKRGYIVQRTDEPVRVRMPGEIFVFIDMENKNIDFDEVPEEDIEQLGEDLEEAMSKLKEWELSVRMERG